MQVKIKVKRKHRKPHSENSSDSSLKDLSSPILTKKVEEFSVKVLKVNKDLLMKRKAKRDKDK